MVTDLEVALAGTMILASKVIECSEAVPNVTVESSVTATLGVYRLKSEPPAGVVSVPDKVYS